jgi:anti-sigma factor RsiW
MLFNPNDITLSNYEEYFILYMDNELDAAGRQMVEAFISLHPHLADELDTLMSTRLPVDDMFFTIRKNYFPLL